MVGTDDRQALEASKVATQVKAVDVDEIEVIPREMTLQRRIEGFGPIREMREYFSCQNALHMGPDSPVI
jgi:hypothetical protein